METVGTISSGTQRRSLGARKKGEARKKPVRTAVVLPADVDWPDVDETVVKEILDTIKKELKCLDIPKRKCSLKDLASVPKEQRREVRKRVIAEQNLRLGVDIGVCNSKRQQVCIGINACSKCIDAMDQDTKEESLVGLIIEKDVDPQIITKLLVPIAISKRIPVISLFGLRDAAKDAAGIKCIALGLKGACLNVGTSGFYDLAHLVLKHGLQNPENQTLEIISPVKSLGSDFSHFSIEKEIEKLEERKEDERKSRENVGSADYNLRFPTYHLPKIRRMDPNRKSDPK